jgi:uncharacterized Zn finger protein
MTTFSSRTLTAVSDKSEMSIGCTRCGKSNDVRVEMVRAENGVMTKRLRLRGRRCWNCGTSLERGEKDD